MNEEEIKATIEETLQGHLRAIIGKLTPEELYQDRQKFSQEVQNAAAPDLADMGFRIVTFPIKDVRDRKGYLDALGERRTAEVKRNGKKAALLAAAEGEKASLLGPCRG